MRRLSPLRRSPFLDLTAFALVLITGVTLVALGLSPESLAAVTIALAGLYSAWRTGRPPVAPPGEVDAHEEKPRPRGPEEDHPQPKDKAPEKEEAK